MSLFPRRANWQIFYEVLSSDQERAAQFVRDVLTKERSGSRERR